MAVPEGFTFGILAMLFYGLADFVAKKAVGKYGSLTALKYSYLVGATMALAYSLVFVKFPQITSSAIVFVLLSAVIGAGGWILFYKALGIGKVSIVSPISSSWGIVPFILGMILLSEKLTVFQIISAISIFAGIIFVSVSLKELLETKKKLYAGAGIAILSMIGFGISAFFIKFSVDLVGVFYSVALIRMATLPFIFLYAAKAKHKTAVENKFIWLLVAVGLLDVLGFLSFSSGLSSGLVSIVSAITSATPLVVIILAYLFLKERLAVNQYFGIAFIIAGFVGLAVQ